MLSLLEPEFQSQIRQICIFGSAGNEAILVMKDDDVYAMGSNCSSCLGLGEENFIFIITDCGVANLKLNLACVLNQLR